MPVCSRILPSTPDAAAEASDLLIQVATDWGISDELRERILLVVGEAVANAAEHGNMFDLSKQVLLEYELEGGEIFVRVEHQGPGIREGDLQAATLPDDPLDTGGRGLFIIRELAERVWLEAEGRRICMGWYVRAKR